jgi:hypothetical protein
MGGSWKKVLRLEPVEKRICAINTQNSTRFWVDIRYKRSVYSIFWSFLEISKKSYFCSMSIYATNTQFTPRFWVDMRYRVAYINELQASVRISEQRQNN